MHSIFQIFLVSDEIASQIGGFLSPFFFSIFKYIKDTFAYNVNKIERGGVKKKSQFCIMKNLLFLIKYSGKSRGCKIIHELRDNLKIPV